MLVFLEAPRLVTLAKLDREDFIGEIAGDLCCCETFLGTLSPPILILAGNLPGFDEILGMPARMLARESIVQSVIKHTVVHLRVAEPITPAASRDKVRRAVHVLHPARECAVDQAEHNFLRCRGDGLCTRAADFIHGHQAESQKAMAAVVGG